MTDYSIAGSAGTTGLSQATVLADGDLFPFVKVADHSTPPAGSAGSDQAITARNAAAAFYRGAKLVLPVSGNTASGNAAAIQAADDGSSDVVKLAPVAWNIACGTISHDGAKFWWDATGASITASGTGALFRLFDHTAGGGGAKGGGGGLLGKPYIDMSGCSGKCYATQFGDILGLVTTGSVTGASATSDSASFAWDNHWGGCEQMTGDVYSDGSSIAFLFTQHPDVSSTNCVGSFERGSMRFRADQESISNQVFRVENGAYMTGSVWDSGGNAASAASGTATTAVYSVQGEAPSGSADGAGNPSSMFDFTVYSCWEVEGGPVFPFTFLVDQATNPSNPCFVDSLQGRLDFSAGAGNNFQQAGAFTVTNFTGTVIGDPSIVPQQGSPQGFGSFATAQTVATSGTITPLASYWEVTSTANATGVALASGGADGQMLILRNTGSHTIAITSPAFTLAASGGTQAFWWSASQSSWSTQASGSGFSNPMTTLGDMIYGGTSGTATQLSGNTTTTRKFFRQTGTGSASAAPAWDTLLAADVPTLNQSTTGNAATATNLAGGAALPAYLAPKVTTLTDGSSIAVNAALGNDFKVTLGGNRTMAAPSNPLDGQKITFEVIQDGTGSRTLTWTTGSSGAYSFGSGTAPTLTTTAGASDLVGFRYSSTKSRWLYLGAQGGF